MGGVGFHVDPDHANGRMLVGWTQDGIVHKTNILLPGGSRIVLHRHSYDHTFRIKSGDYLLTDIAPGGAEKVTQVSEGDELLMPAWHRHSFDRIDDRPDPGVIDCFWPEGADG